MRSHIYARSRKKAIVYKDSGDYFILLCGLCDLSGLKRIMTFIDVTAAVIRKNGKVLIVQRAAGEHLEGLWEFPGGKIEQGETPEQCLKRELYEEFGIDTGIGRFITESRFSYRNKSIRLLAYEAEHLGGDFSLKVHSVVSRVAIDQLANYSFAPADVPILEKLDSQEH